MLILHREKTPCWNQLVYNPQHPSAIELLVHTDAEDSLYSIPEKELEFLIPKDEFFSLGSFTAKPNSNWGIDEVFKRIDSENKNFIAFRIEPPCAKKFKSEKCNACDGTGFEDKLNSHKCNFCENGYESYYDWKEVFPYCASLQLLERVFAKYQFGEKETTADTPQLLTFNTCMQKSLFALTGTYGPILVNWFRDKHNTNLEFARDAMGFMWGKVMGSYDTWDKHYMKARIEDAKGWVNLGCPGDACGLHPMNEYDMCKGHGYEYTCHNMDHPGQQLTLLAGLAAIETLARKELGL